MMYQINLVALRTIVFNEIHRFMRIWKQTLLPSVVTISLYFIVFHAFIAKRVGTIDGHPYMQFLAPGLIMLAIINNSYSNVVSSFYATRFQRSIDELLIAPVANWVIIIGYVLGGICRGILNGIAVTAVALYFTPIYIHHWGIAILSLLLTSTLFALIGFTNAIFARSFDDVSIVPTFVLTPLTFLGGVFYSINHIPPLWRMISRFNPILYMVNSFRYGILGFTDIPVSTALTTMSLLIVVFFGVNLILLRKGIGLRS